MPVGKLRELLAECDGDDWIYADRNGDLAVIKAENLETLKNAAYPSDAVVDLISESWKESG